MRRCLPGGFFLEKALDVLMKRNDTIFVISGEIADWFVSADKTGLAELEAALKVRPASAPAAPHGP